jgi:hypothetical protein
MRKNLYQNNVAKFICGLVLSAIAGFFIFYSFSSRQNSDEINNKISVEPEVVSHSIKSDFGKLPLGFEANAGQIDRQVKFVSRGQGFALFLTDAEAVLSLRKNDRQTPPAVLRMRLDGANQTPEVVGQNELAGKSNYFVGDNPNEWKTDVPNYSRVHYKEVYPGIDQIFYGNGRELEYDFIVAPEAEPNIIALDFTGAEKLEIDANGDLILNVGGEQIRQQRPVVYQEINGEKYYVAGNYELKSENKIGFEIGEYDRAKPLVIDPVLVYSTYLGGNGFDQGYAIAVDSSGNTYLTGRTSTTDFPTTGGAFDTTYNGSTDAFVTKINATGNALVYSTYIAGAVGNGIAVDSSGNAYVTGEAGPPNFPTTPGAFQTSPYDFDAFILKLNQSGSALVYSSRFGSNFADYGNGIAVDVSGNAYITGWTVCRAPTCTFPVVNAFQPNYGGGYNDGFVTKINSTGSALVYSTYLGGGQIINATEDWGEGIAVDGAGSAYVTGYTYSPDFPVTPGAYDTERCGLDAFITKFAPDGRTLVYSTFLGGCAREQGMGIAVDAAGNAFVAGWTESTTFPTTAGAFQTTGSFDAFVTKLNPTGTALVYSTYLGGSADVDRGWDIAIDTAGNAYIAGDTKSNNFPVADAIQPDYGGGYVNAFASKLNPAGTALVYSTYLGGNSFDGGRNIAVDGSGSAYITGYASSDNFPVTAGAFQMQNGGGFEHHDDAFVAKIQGQQIQTRRTLFDFDGDGKTDISIFRPSVGEWWYLRSSDNQNRAFQFGNSSDKLVPADFTGDGKTDIAVWRPSTGEWFVLRSDDNSYYSFQFGTGGDSPAVGDFDADGRTDAAIFRPSTAAWYISKSSGGTLIQQFGQNGDVPVVSDYDGDGKSDIAIYRVSLGQWWIQRSTGGTIAFQFGNSTDKSVQRDYTGDGMADVAFWRPTTGEWFVLRSENQSYYSVPFGANGDRASPGDYDGDGKSDFAVFRPSNLTWYMQRSTAGTLIQGFGITGDISVPNAFVP